MPPWRVTRLIKKCYLQRTFQETTGFADLKIEQSGLVPWFVGTGTGMLAGYSQLIAHGS